MNEPVKEQLNKKKTSVRSLCKWRYVLSFLVMDLIIVFLAVVLLKEEPLYYPQSEKIIGIHANKDILETKQLSLSGKKLPDIKPVKKFINLEYLYLSNNGYTQGKIPSWKKFLTKLHIHNFSNQNGIDLSPLKKLYKLEKIKLRRTPVKNIRPLSGLTNLKELDLCSTTVRDLSPLRNLKILEHLDLSDNPVSNLEPLKNLENLKVLGLVRCPNITKEQIDDLKKALPNLSVTTISEGI